MEQKLYACVSRMCVWLQKKIRSLIKYFFVYHDFNGHTGKDFSSQYLLDSPHKHLRRCLIDGVKLT